MINSLLKKYQIVIIVYIIYQVLLYLKRINLDNPIAYFNFVLYFLTFLIIRETLQKTNLNKVIIYIFYGFYGYLSIIMSLVVLTRNIRQVDYFVFVYSDVILKLFILTISIYITLHSFYFWRLKIYPKIFWSILFAVMLIVLNYYKYLLDPFILIKEKNWADYALRNYTAIVIANITLLIFWYRYYHKYVVVTEYLNTIIFIFTLSNIIETLHFIAFQWNAQIWLYGQIFNFFLNGLMLVFWFLRLLYLNSEISIKNERYLEHFQMLNGIVTKPKAGLVLKIIPFFSINYLAVVLISLILILLGLYFVKKITIYLLLNTFFIIFAIIFALFFSFSSVKRDWHNQVGILLKKKDE